ncbi:sulfite exporter TauE/SafE family protein [Desulfococcus multivorans]|uniref:Probable membrane transporter protein n=2 Tax=Desulfococcus TaxID=896 RepID=S7UQV3_DESML|nr:sulfite exporter TauE/SafE family protein [Desulfococcus multivorans]AOY60662.1 conserved uncharacterized protein, DUF81 [Desulfococcus multivorans]EPR34678.1 protein of unknown function DUF81 [Desulfococcus multivorans DSM 2059]MDX9819136.1 sulfite exporter TauE/SafE family protein [Desulfococcus multivorans]SKA02725.1 Uncharacterized membrane protein YfcA [Desulfococcus multivorans DSM 2059]
MCDIGPVNHMEDDLFRKDEMYSIVLLYTAMGAVAGVLAGLLGIGGGLVIVPMLVFCFTWQKMPSDLIMHLALGTSMASIVFTAVSSFWAHHKRGAVHWVVVRRIVLGILVGTFLGTCIAARLSTGFLKGFFVVFLYYVAIQMLTGRKPKGSRQLPGSLGMFGVGSVIGAVSSLVGIGGGTLSVPFMIWCNMTVHHAIGTSAAIGFPIAVAGTAGYIYNGWGASGLPSYALGYVYLPALVGLVCASVITAPLGVRLAHSLPVARLKRIFAVLLLLVATRMLWSIL